MCLVDSARVASNSGATSLLVVALVVAFGGALLWAVPCQRQRLGAGAVGGVGLGGVCGLASVAAGEVAVAIWHPAKGHACAI